MATDITFLGHAGFLIGDGDHAVAIDPFLTDNPVAVHKPQDIRCQTIALTHGHADHVGDTVEIAKANGATVIAAFELCELLAGKGCQTNGGNPGGRIDTDFGFVALTQAFHSSSYEGQYTGMPCGLVVNIGGVSIYHVGDTCLFGDMKLIGQIYKPDIACIPIGGQFTMGAEQASQAAELIGPKVVIPMHYSTWPLLAQTASGFSPRGVEVRELAPGQTWRHEPA